MTLSLVIRLSDDTVIEVARGDLLFDRLDVIDEIAAAADLRGLSDFSDDRDVPDDFDGDLDDLRALLGPPTTWHDASAATDDFDAVAAALGDGEGADLAAALTALAATLRDVGGTFVLDVADTD